QFRVCVFEYHLDVGNVAGANPRDLGNFFPHINTLSFWQLCRTFVLAAGAYVVARPLLKVELQCQGQTNSYKSIPAAPGLMAGKYETQASSALRWYSMQ